MSFGPKPASAQQQQNSTMHFGKRHIDPMAARPKRNTIPPAGISVLRGGPTAEHHRRKFLTPPPADTTSPVPVTTTPSRPRTAQHGPHTLSSPFPMAATSPTPHHIKKHVATPVHDSLGIRNPVLGTVDKNTSPSSAKKPISGVSRSLVAHGMDHPLPLPVSKKTPPRPAPAPFATTKPVSPRWNQPQARRGKAHVDEPVHEEPHHSAKKFVRPYTADSVVLQGPTEPSSSGVSRRLLGGGDKKPASKLRFTPRKSYSMKTPRVRGMKLISAAHPKRNPITGKGNFGVTPRHGPHKVTNVAAGQHHSTAPFDTSFARSPFAQPSGRGMHPMSAISRISKYKATSLKF